jgi:5'-methylthioinosine phosphorylase
MVDIAVIGGTGFNSMPGAELVEQHAIATPYGDTSAPLQVVAVGARRVVFLARHGRPHRIPPHRVNYRANLWALREHGVSRVLAVNAVGGIERALPAGSIVVPDQIIDYTADREHTFYDGAAPGLEHVDFSLPYTPALRALLLRAGADTGAAVIDGGVYGATQGPRLETAAEIERMARDGCTLVGMTGMPEAALARELNLDYAALCLVVNPAAGRAPGPITMADIERVMVAGMARVQRLLLSALAAA